MLKNMDQMLKNNKVKDAFIFWRVSVETREERVKEKKKIVCAKLVVLL